MSTTIVICKSIFFERIFVLRTQTMQKTKTRVQGTLNELCAYCTSICIIYIGTLIFENDALMKHYRQHYSPDNQSRKRSSIKCDMRRNTQWFIMAISITIVILQKLPNLFSLILPLNLNSLPEVEFPKVIDIDVLENVGQGLSVFQHYFSLSLSS